MKMHKFLILFSCLFTAPQLHAETIQFAFSESDPPLSYKEAGNSVGLLPEIAELIVELEPSISLTSKTFSWSEAQEHVRKGDADAFLTFPSKERQAYASFTSSPAFNLDYGYLIFKADNPARQRMEEAEGFEEIKDLTLLREQGSEWESDNIPEFVTGKEAPNAKRMLQILMRGEAGDYVVMPPESAAYISKELGYKDESGYPVRLSFHKVDFINNSDIPFHVGIRKTHPNAKAIIEKLNGVIQSQEFLKRRAQLIEAYRAQ